MVSENNVPGRSSTLSCSYFPLVIPQFQIFKGLEFLIFCFVFVFAFSFWVLWDLETTLSLSYEKYEWINSKLFQLYVKKMLLLSGKKLRAKFYIREVWTLYHFFPLECCLLKMDERWKILSIKILGILHFLNLPGGLQ